jgi:serine/threonine protein kinase
MSQPSVMKTPQGPQVGPYVFGKTLGTGSTGKVKLARNRNTGEIVAIKIVRKDFLDRKPSLKRKMRREISVLKLLNHPNVMSLIDVFEIDTHLFLVMEYVDGLELFEFLVRRGKLPPNEALGFFHQIICGLEYCHRRLICHRDLKPENLVRLERLM